MYLCSEKVEETLDYIFNLFNHLKYIDEGRYYNFQYYYSFYQKSHEQYDGIWNQSKT